MRPELSTDEFRNLDDVSRSSEAHAGSNSGGRWTIPTSRGGVDTMTPMLPGAGFPGPEFVIMLAAEYVTLLLLASIALAARPKLVAARKIGEQRRATPPAPH